MELEKYTQELKTKGYRVENGKLYNPDGLVAVVYSPGYGAGWVTWNDDVDPCNPFIAAAVLMGNNDFILEVAAQVYPEAYTGGLVNVVKDKQAMVAWVPPGTGYRIEEYDGYESLEFRDSIGWRTT